MAESETARKITKTIKTLDKFLADVVKNGKAVKEALEELKESKEKEK